MRGAGTSRTTHVYDAAGQNVLVATSDPVGGVVRRLTYSYDVAGRRDGQVAPGPVATAWAYGAAGQLGAEARTGLTGFLATHVYDPAGNRVANEGGAVNAVGKAGGTEIEIIGLMRREGNTIHLDGVPFTKNEGGDWAQGNLGNGVGTF